MVKALDRAGGDVSLIEWTRDPAIEAIVETWPARFAPDRAEEMGFPRDQGIDEIIQAYKEDDL
jgi:hypothetical protein